MTQLFRKDGERLAPVRRTHFPLERDLQRLCESNLDALFGLQFVRSEFALKGFRIDTLAFDPENVSFVIIEYKRGANFSVVDQGFAYLNVLLANPAEFVLVYNESCSERLKKDDFDWRRSRVYFIAPSFTPYQRQAVNFRDLPIDLWEVSAYGDDTVVLTHVGDESSAPSIGDVTTGPSLGTEAKKAVNYSIEDHLQGRPVEIRAIHEQLSGAIRAFGDVTERPISVAILYEAGGKRFAEIILQKKQIVVHFDNYDQNPRGLSVRDFLAEGKGRYWAVGDYQVKVRPGDDIASVLDLLRSSYRAAVEGS